VLRNACNAYDKLIDEQPIEFHAAYIANLEATFTPLFKVLLDNRDSLFGGGDRGRVADDVALRRGDRAPSSRTICRHINPDPWCRVKHSRATFHHVGALAQTVAETFDKVIPFEDRGASARELMSRGLMTREFRYRVPGGRRRRARGDGPPSIFQTVPTSQLVKMVWRLALSQTPKHNPADQPLPDWADTWMREYDRGTDMTTFVGSPPLPPAER
jgi:hypothetical protein